jgi:2-polyprenyl-6-methoxyphenol hydroxylase-like FAD-dependent oxidoreductase
MSNKRDIAICGCGPAGLAAALLLGRAGHRVRVFDQFDAPRPIGSGLILQPTGLAVLDELGVLGIISTLGAQIERLYGRVVPSHKVVLDVRYRALGAGWRAIAVHRAALFGVLHEAVRAADIEIVTGKRIVRIEDRGMKPALVAANEERLGAFDLIVDALGANSSLANRKARRKVLPYGALWTTVAFPQAGPFQAEALEQRYRRASHMAGVLPIGRRAAGGRTEAAFFWSLKRRDVAHWRARGVDAWKEDVAALWPQAVALLGDVTHCDEMTFAQYDHFTLPTPWSGRLVHIGDAAHATSPQLGQGANMALLDALALARAVAISPDIAEAPPRYARMRRWHVRLFQWASAMFTPFYQSDSRLLPIVRDRFAAPLSRQPVADAVLARLVSGMTVAPLADLREASRLCRQASLTAGEPLASKPAPPAGKT